MICVIRVVDVCVLLFASFHLCFCPSLSISSSPSKRASFRPSSARAWPHCRPSLPPAPRAPRAPPAKVHAPVHPSNRSAISPPPPFPPSADPLRLRPLLSQEWRREGRLQVAEAVAVGRLTAERAAASGSCQRASSRRHCSADRRRRVLRPPPARLPRQHLLLGRAGARPQPQQVCAPANWRGQARRSTARPRIHPHDDCTLSAPIYCSAISILTSHFPSLA